MKIAALILGLSLLVFAAIFVNSVRLGRESAAIIGMTANARQIGIGQATYFSSNSPNGTKKIPVTWNVLWPFMLVGQDEDIARSIGGPNIEQFSIGPIKAIDMMTGKAGGQHMIDVAVELGIPDQSWEFVMGYWLSRQVEDYEAQPNDVLIGFTRQRLPSGKTVFIALSNRGSVQGSLASAESIKARLDLDRVARNELVLTTLPPEFESWLITGEPASVGDGTFVPPSLSPASADEPEGAQPEQ